MHRLSLAAVVVLAAYAFAAAGTSRAGEGRESAGGLTGQLLVATSQIEDPRFMRTVIYMVQHDAGGAVGLVVNRPIGEVPLARVLEQVGLAADGVTGTIRVHYGGPVDRARGFVLHTAEYAGKGTIPVTGSVALTSESGILRDLAAGTGPRQSLFALGYAGWGPGQLEREMDAGHWITVRADEALVFDADSGGKWQRAMARRGIRL